MNDLARITEIATSYMDIGEALSQVQTDHPYFRKVLKNIGDVEVVLICMADMQSTHLHNHDGIAVIRCLCGRAIERLYVRDTTDDLLPFDTRHLREGEVSALGPHIFHQITNLAKNGSVFLNFYSPAQNPAGLAK